MNSFSGDSHSESFVDNVARASRDGKSENAANAPTTADASRLLEDRGLVVIPDIVANAGGVTCSYFEQVQGQTNYYWDRADVLGKVDSLLQKTFGDVYERAERECMGLRDAAYLIAVDRVARACRERGWV